MSNIIPPWQFKAACPQCGAELKIKRENEHFPVQLEGNERLICAVHGDVMSLDEARRIAFKDNRDDIIDKAREFARESLRGSIRDIFKK